MSISTFPNRLVSNSSRLTEGTNHEPLPDHRCARKPKQAVCVRIDTVYAKGIRFSSNHCAD